MVTPHYIFSCISQPNNIEILQRLLNVKADTSLVNCGGSTPLHFAAEYTNDVNIIHTLTLCSNPNLVNFVGNTPLIIACIYNTNYLMLDALINITNDLNRTNIIGDTALHTACAYKNYNAISLLLKAKADLNITQNNNNVAYEIADTKGKDLINEYLILH